MLSKSKTWQRLLFLCDSLHIDSYQINNRFKILIFSFNNYGKFTYHELHIAHLLNIKSRLHFLNLAYSKRKKCCNLLSRHFDTEEIWKRCQYVSRQLKITWASRWPSANLWRSSRDWLTLFSSWRAICMASSPVPHSSRSGFYKQHVLLHSKFYWKVKKPF